MQGELEEPNKGLNESSNEEGSDSEMIRNDNTPLIPLDGVRVYKRRWLMLIIFSLNTMVTGVLFMGISSISSISVKHYKVSSVLVEWTSSAFLVIYVVAGLPASFIIFKLGLRPVLIISSALNVAATALHYAGYSEKGFQFVIIGQIFGAFAFSAVLQMPGRLSSVWFADHERGTTTAIGVFMNLVGVAIGFVQPTHMVYPSKNPHVVKEEFRVFYLSQLAACALIFIFTMVCFREEPPTPPTYASFDETGETFSGYIKMLGTNKYFSAMSQSYGIYYGLLVTFSVLLNSFVTSKYKEGYEAMIGWMGFACTLAGILSCLICGMTLDKFKKHRCVAIFLNSGAMVTWCGFILILTKTDSFLGAFIMFTIFGAFGYPYFAAGLEQAAEMTYPVPEETSSAVVIILGSLYGFAFILGFGYLIQIGFVELVGYAFVGLYFIATVLACVSKTEMKRAESELIAALKSQSNSSASSKETWCNINVVKREKAESPR